MAAGADRDDAGGSLIRAAGCVLWRRAGADTEPAVTFCLIHRPKHDDWSHPKGKLLRGETPAEAAVREVKEETGMTCRLGPALSTASYVVADGRPKEVTYWAAESAGGTFHPNAEVDRLVWLPPDEARERLSHPADRALLDEALTALGVPQR